MQMDFYSINHVKSATPTGVYGGITREFVVGRDNIVDELRSDYCDMNAPYTVWKHTPVPPIVGFHGYRKHIMFRDEPPGWRDIPLNAFKDYQRWLSEEPASHFNKLLIAADVLTVEPFNCGYNGGMAKDYILSRSPRDWRALEGVMSDHGQFNFDTHFIRPMHFVCRDYVFHRWMRFWDKVRLELEPLVLADDAVTEDYPKRAMAFLSERVWSLWLDQSNLRVQEFPLLICWDAT
ncbi:MAG TPA: DUF4422 domain-containing protein [Candidatus Saccharimonadia bacterium]|nr:DUF4422 domain-containing protein [Candidatus Saccharimonadia bacterium]